MKLPKNVSVKRILSVAADMEASPVEPDTISEHVRRVGAAGLRANPKEAWEIARNAYLGIPPDKEYEDQAMVDYARVMGKLAASIAAFEDLKQTKREIEQLDPDASFMVDGKVLTKADLVERLAVVYEQYSAFHE